MNDLLLWMALAQFNLTINTIKNLTINTKKYLSIMNTVKYLSI